MDAHTYAGGDRKEALESLYRTHWDFVARSVRRMGVPEAAAEDVAQDVFLVARRRLSGFEGRSAVRTWLYGIARRVAKDHRRSSDRLQRRLARVEPPPPPPTPDDLVARARASEQLAAILAGLDDKKRAVYVLAEIEGMTAQEIAGLLGVGCNTVYSRLRLAREAIAIAVGRRPALAPVRDDASSWCDTPALAA